MANKLDCTDKAFDIMMEHTTWRKPKRMTPKREKIINESWNKWKVYRQALINAKLYGGSSWSGDRKWPKVDINTKDKFIKTMLTQHSICLLYTSPSPRDRG